MLKTSFLVLISFVISIFFTSCGVIVKSKANNYITLENKAIPPEFGKQNDTLLFITHHRSYNKYLIRNVKKIYKGNYKFITEDDLKNTIDYKNVDVYRFVFDYNYEPSGDYIITNTFANSNFNSATPRIRPALYNLKRFKILDRKSQKIYYCKMTTSYWSKLQKVYIKKLNEQLISSIY